jgi:hypothetical protein
MPKEGEVETRPESLGVSGRYRSALALTVPEIKDLPAANA